MGPAGCLRPATPPSSVPSKLSSPCLNAFHDSPPTPGTVWEGKKCLSLGNPSLSHAQLKKPAHSPTAQLSFHKVWALRRASVFFHPVLKEALKFTCSRKTGTRGASHVRSQAQSTLAQGRNCRPTAVSEMQRLREDETGEVAVWDLIREPLSENSPGADGPWSRAAPPGSDDSVGAFQPE